MATSDTFTAGVPVNPYHVIQAGWNLSATGDYTVRAGKEMYITHISMSAASAQEASISPEYRIGGTGPWLRIAEIHTKATPNFPVRGLRGFPAGTDFRFTARVGAGTGDVNIWVDIELRDV